MAWQYDTPNNSTSRSTTRPSTIFSPREPKLSSPASLPPSSGSSLQLLYEEPTTNSLRACDRRTMLITPDRRTFVQSMMQDAGRLVSGNAVPATRGPLYSYSFPSSEDTLEIRPCSSYHVGTMGPNRPGATPPPKRGGGDTDEDSELEEYIAVTGGGAGAGSGYGHRSVVGARDTNGRYSPVRAGPSSSSSSYRTAPPAASSAGYLPPSREHLTIQKSGGGGYRASAAGSYGTPQDRSAGKQQQGYEFEDVTRHQSARVGGSYEGDRTPNGSVRRRMF
jgi:hypothetical protein